MSTQFLSGNWRLPLLAVTLGLLSVSQAQVATNVLNDGTTAAGLIRLHNLAGTNQADIDLYADVGGLVAEQNNEYSDFPVHAAWYVSSIRVVSPSYLVSVAARPADEYPETRVGVMGWIEPAANKGIALRVRPNPTGNRFEVSVVDFAATTLEANDSTTGLFTLDGAPADPVVGSAQAEAGDYRADTFATFSLEFAAPTATDLAAVPEATARLTARVLQADTTGQTVEVGDPIELLTTLPVPAQHQVGYYANWNSTDVAGSTIGTLRLLTIVGEIIQVNQKPLISLTSPTAGATSKEPGSFDLAATASDPDGTILKVDFLQGTAVVGTATNAPYAGVVSGLAAGEYQFAARATDNQGATTTTPAVTVTVLPNEPPNVTITHPFDGAQYVAPASFDLTADATDPDGTVATVEYFRGPTSLGSASEPPYTVSVTDLPVGTFIFTAKATDDRGASRESAPITIQVRPNQAPLVSITSPQEGAEFFAPAEFDFIAQANDLDGGVAKVEFFAGATLLGTVTQSPFVFRVTNLEAGAHALIAKATDNRGASTTSSPVNITVRANLAPEVVLTNPTAGAQFVAPATVELAATASDPDGTVVGVEFFRDDISLGSVTEPPYVLTVSDLAAGSYVLTAKATDNRGASRVSEPVAIEVRGNQAPTVTIIEPSSGAKLDAPATFNLVATASDPDGQVAKVEFWRDGAVIASITTPPYQTTVAALPAGSYQFEAVATDDKGAASTPAVVTVAVVSTGTQARLVNPTPLPSATDFQQFQVTLNGEPGKSYVVERTSDFLTWTELETVTLQSATLVRTYPRDAAATLVALRLRESTGPTVSPKITNPTPLPSATDFQQFQVTLNGEPGKSYVVERTSDFLTWSPIETVTLVGSTLVRTYPRDAAAKLVALRLREGAGPVAPPEISNPRPLPSAEDFQQLAFTITGSPGATYVVEKTSDFVTWTLVETITLTGASIDRVYPHAPDAGLVAYRVRVAGGGPVTPPELAGPEALPSTTDFQQFRFSATGLAGKRYRVESSSNLQTWTEVATGTASGDSVSLTYPRSAASPYVFFRLAILP